MAARKRYLFACVATVFGAGFMLGSAVRGTGAVRAQSANRVFELRTYTTPEGRLDDLQAGFRDNTMRLFERHGMTNVGYWTPQDAPNSSNTLVYIIVHNSREAAETSWQNFRDDPEWQRVSRESQANGRIVDNIESVFLDPTDYSPMQ
jgi:hypothetical protein